MERSCWNVDDLRGTGGKKCPGVLSPNYEWRTAKVAFFFSFFFFFFFFMWSYRIVWEIWCNTTSFLSENLRSSFACFVPLLRYFFLSPRSLYLYFISWRWRYTVINYRPILDLEIESETSSSLQSVKTLSASVTNIYHFP